MSYCLVLIYSSPCAPSASLTGSQISRLTWQWCPGWNFTTLCLDTWPKPPSGPFLVVPSINLIAGSNLSNMYNFSSSGWWVAVIYMYWLVFGVYISLMLILNCCLFLLGWLKLPVFRNWSSTNSPSTANNTGIRASDCESQLLYSISTYTCTLN